ncbi:S-adenosylmethionine synthetase [Enterococcus sp. DIV0212c]|uniref:methionine adenosyltransferase n=1 Tax=Enterococcus sp. DIV0212c TaxID=2230867 RepID=UPI001A9AFB72|nr:methionine adenosyltransferase [Enterococcus sp. DIV0212c]MBO1354672.1 S-adenosylmethionine synthetase [Enterococcus sp. DIV0212c]
MINYYTLSSNERYFESVERKGIGHPDTICDALAEKMSQLYSKYCYDQFDKLCHHWFDKVLLIGGESNFSFGKGEITKPYEVHLMGKCVMKINKHEIPLKAIFQEACKEVFESSLTDFDVSKYLELYIHVTDYQGPENHYNRYRPKEIDDLVDLSMDLSLQISNDCNICVGYYPLSVCEEAVYKVEQYLNNPVYKIKHPEVGCDIKVFGRRTNKEIDLLVRLPFVSKYTPSKSFYDLRLNKIKDELITLVSKINQEYQFKLRINEGDSPEQAYLTVTGTVADTGDVGCVGRGNRINGLITPGKPQSIEAPSGKNPIDHTGKLYSILASDIAKKIYSITGMYNEVYLNSMKHKKLNDPDAVIVLTEKELTSKNKLLIEKYIQGCLDDFTELTKNIIFQNKNLW